MIAMIGSAAARGAVAWVGLAGRVSLVAAEVGGAAVRAARAAVAARAARVRRAGGRWRRVAVPDCAIGSRVCMPMPLEMPSPGNLPGITPQQTLGSGGWFQSYGCRSIKTNPIHESQS